MKQFTNGCGPQGIRAILEPLPVNGNVMRAEIPALAPIGEQVSIIMNERAAWAMAS